MRECRLNVFFRAVSIALILACLFFVAPLCAQSTRKSLPLPGSGSLTLDTLLDRLEQNISDYRKSIPNLFCRERATSSIKSGGQVEGPGQASPDGYTPPTRSPIKEWKVVSEGTFRLQRNTEVGKTGAFEEIRIIEYVNGEKPKSKQDLKTLYIPAVLYGVFSNGLNILSQEGRTCFRFRIHPSEPGELIVVDFHDLPANERGSQCPAYEATSGRILVDPASMHVVRIEKKIPDHELIHGVRGRWNWSEDFAPVTLLDQQFWMPTRIQSEGVAHSGSPAWHFDGVYTDYHLFHAEARIVPEPAN